MLLPFLLALLDKAFNPMISVNLVYDGVRYDVIHSIQHMLERFWREKVIGSLNISMDFVQQYQRWDGVRDLSNLIEKGEIRLTPDCDFFDKMVNLHSSFIVNSGGKYTLFFVNVPRNKSVPIKFGIEDEAHDCFLLDVGCAFCRISCYENCQQTIFAQITNFIDEIVLPSFPKRDSPAPSKLFIPIVSFGPKILLTSLQKKLRDLTPAAETVVLVDHRKIADLPLIDVLYTNKDMLSISEVYNVLENTHYVRDDEYYDEEEREFGKAVLTVYVWPAKNRSYVDVMGNVAVVFGNEDNVESLVMTAIGRAVFGIEKEISFGGYHPFYPNGGSLTFSELIKDAINRNWAFDNVRYIIKQMKLINRTQEQIQEIGLDFMYQELDEHVYEDVASILGETEDAITNDRLGMALASSRKGVEFVDSILQDLQVNLFEAKMLGNCCRETVYVSPKLNRYLLALVLCSFFAAFIWIIRRVLKERRLTSLPRALV